MFAIVLKPDSYQNYESKQMGTNKSYNNKKIIGNHSEPIEL